MNEGFPKIVEQLVFSAECIVDMQCSLLDMMALPALHSCQMHCTYSACRLIAILALPSCPYHKFFSFKAETAMARGAPRLARVMI